MDEAAERDAAGGADAVSPAAPDEAPTKSEGAEKLDERGRARAAARAERQAQKDAVKADKAARKRAASEAKAKRKAERKRQRAERSEREKAKAKPAPAAEEKKPTRAEQPRRQREKTEAPRAERKPRAERAGAGVALKRAGTKVNSVLTGPRAGKAASRVDSGMQSAWKLLLAGLATLLAGALIIGRFVLGGLRELGALWIRAAEILGEAILWAYRHLRPIVLAALRALRRGLEWAERVVTPKRAVAFVVIAAAVTLAASQFVDYRGVRIGAPEYAGVEAVAPAPQTDRQTTGSVHGYAMVPVAVVIIVAALLALQGRWRMARIIPVLAGLAIAVTLLLDARKGLDEGDAEIAYQGAQAVLIEGFWLQLASAAVLVVTGILLARYARLSGAPARRRRPSGDGREEPDGGDDRSPRRKRRFGIAGVRA